MLFEVAMPSLSDTVINVRELIGRPGTSRSLESRLPAPTDLSDEIVRIQPELTLRGVIESVVEGLLVRATITAPVRVACVRCLTERDEMVQATVVELFSAPRTTDDPAVDAGYEIVEHTIDVDTLLRDALAAAVPSNPLCRPDCAGLCPTCGADLNVAPCDGHLEQQDPRWSVLADVQIPDFPR
jgi:uncharacterized protein